MNRSASGLRDRLLTVMMETLIRLSGNLTGSFFSESRFALKRRTELGSMRNEVCWFRRSAALEVRRSAATLARGGSRPLARKISAISAPGTLS